MSNRGRNRILGIVVLLAATLALGKAELIRIHSDPEPKGRHFIDLNEDGIVDLEVLFKDVQSDDIPTSIWAQDLVVEPANSNFVLGSKKSEGYIVGIGAYSVESIDEEVDTSEQTPGEWTNRAVAVSGRTSTRISRDPLKYLSTGWQGPWGREDPPHLLVAFEAQDGYHRAWIDMRLDEEGFSETSVIGWMYEVEPIELSAKRLMPAVTYRRGPSNSLMLTKLVRGHRYRIEHSSDALGWEFLTSFDADRNWERVQVSSTSPKQGYYRVQHEWLSLFPR